MNMYYPKCINGEPWKYGSCFMFVLADSGHHADQTLRSWLQDRHEVRALEELRLCTMFKVPECFRLDPMTDPGCMIISEADLQPSVINRIRRETDDQLTKRINSAMQLVSVWTETMLNTTSYNRKMTIIGELINLNGSLQMRINELMYRLNAGKENHNGME